jgi:hypothetical protein
MEISRCTRRISNLSTHGGDEDWLAIIPHQMTNKYISWMGEGTPFGICDIFAERDGY